MRSLSIVFVTVFIDLLGFGIVIPLLARRSHIEALERAGGVRRERRGPVARQLRNGGSGVGRGFQPVRP